MKKIIFILLIISTSLFSQEVVEKEEKPKIGLVLAGGGAWGFAHVAVLRALEEHQIPISYITGTSIGSIIGSLYAMGYTVDELEELIHSTSWFSILNDTIQRNEMSAYHKKSFQRHLLSFSFDEDKVTLPGGFVEGQKVHNLLSRLHWDAKDIDDFSELPIPFRCLATDIKTGDAAVLKSGSLTDAVRASISIPGVFAPVELDGKILVDGMFSRNLPVQDVIDMGADYVIAVNWKNKESVVTDYSSATGTVYQSFLFKLNISVKEQLPLADLVISPDISGYSTFSYGMVQQIYDQGVLASEEKAEELSKLSDPELFQEMKDRRLPRSGEVTINSVKVEGATEDMARNIIKTLGFKKNPVQILSSDDVEKKIGRIYNLGLFDLVTYDINGNELVVEVKPKEKNIVGIAMGYSLKDDVTLLVDLKSRGFDKVNYISDFSVRLGEKTEIRERLSISLGFVNLVGIFSDSTFTHDKYPINNNLDNLKESYEFNTMFGPAISISTFFMGTLGVAYNYFNFNHDEDHSVVLQGSLTLDTLNEELYPDRGAYITLYEIWGVPNLGVDFIKSVFKSYFAIPVVRDRFSLLLGFDGGAVTTYDWIGADGDIPLNQYLYAGGSRPEYRKFSLVGYDRNEFGYAYSSVFHTGIQVQPVSGVYIQGKWDIGFFSESGDRDTYEDFWGYGLFTGVLTPLGAVEVSLEADQEHNLSFNLTLGYSV